MPPKNCCSANQDLEAVGLRATLPSKGGEGSNKEPYHAAFLIVTCVKGLGDVEAE